MTVKPRWRLLATLAAITAGCLPQGSLGSQPPSTAAGRLRISARLLGTGAADCAHGTSGVWKLIGAVARAGQTTLVLDSRSPLENGSALLNTFTVVAPGFPGFDHYLVPADFAQVDLEIRQAGEGACATRILIQSLGAWEGQPSPRQRSFFFAGNDGLWEPFATAPFTVTRSKTDCTRIAAAARPEGQPLAVHLLGAPGSAAPCHDEGWSYWIAPPPPNRSE